MNVPVRAFWFMNSAINRICAEQDLRQLHVQMNAQGSDEARKFQERLVLDMGTVIMFDPIESAERDEAGIKELKAMNSK